VKTSGNNDTSKSISWKVLETALSHLNGTLAINSQTSAIPATLKTLLDVIMRGQTIKRDSAESQACLTVAKLLVFNTISRFRDNQAMLLIPFITLTMSKTESARCPYMQHLRSMVQPERNL